MSLVCYCHRPLEIRHFVHAESGLEENYTKEKKLLLKTTSLKVEEVFIQPFPV